MVSICGVTWVIPQPLSQFQPLTLLHSNIQTYKCSAIVNQFCHEFSASSPPTALPNRLGSTQQPMTTQISPPSEYSRPRPCCSPVTSWRQSEWQFWWSEQLSLPSKELAPSWSHQHLPSSGLGNWNRLNTRRPVYQYGIPRWDVKCWPSNSYTNQK